jgi:hypothetical protein
MAHTSLADHTGSPPSTYQQQQQEQQQQYMLPATRVPLACAGVEAIGCAFVWCLAWFVGGWVGGRAVDGWARQSHACWRACERVVRLHMAASATTQCAKYVPLPGPYNLLLMTLLLSGDAVAGCYVCVCRRCCLLEPGEQGTQGTAGALDG